MKLFLLLYMVTIITDVITGDNCVEPPLECPNENITFWLYTKDTQDSPSQIFPDDKDTIDKAPFNKDVPIKILIHGYTGHKDYAPNTEIRPAYFQRGDYNVISVDWNPIAREPCYKEAAHNIQLVGKCIAQLIDNMIDNHNYPKSQFHVIGFSLGAQSAGAVGNYIKNGKLDRITGLDPAMPLFTTLDRHDKLDMTDANFVDVVHTNALVKGKLEPCGHVDFYANGGLTQPGCMNQEGMTKSGCDHWRAPVYYAESINTNVGFYGTRCFSWLANMIGWCDVIQLSDEELFGEFVSTSAHGLYFFRTNSKSPYARGSNKNNNDFGSTQEERRQETGNDENSNSVERFEELLENKFIKWL